MYGITKIGVKAIEASHEDVFAVNNFLKAHDGEIIDIKPEPMMYGITKYIIIYREAEQ